MSTATEQDQTTTNADTKENITMSTKTKTKTPSLTEAHTAALAKVTEAEALAERTEEAASEAEQAEDEVHQKARTGEGVTALDLLTATAEVTLARLRAEGATRALTAAKRAIPASPHMAMAVADAINGAGIGLTVEAVASVPTGADADRAVSGWLTPGRDVGVRQDAGGATLGASAILTLRTSGAMRADCDVLAEAIGASKSLTDVTVDDLHTGEGEQRFKVTARVSFPEVPVIRGGALTWASGVHLHGLSDAITESATSRYPGVWAEFVLDGNPERTEADNGDGTWTVSQTEVRGLHLRPDAAGLPGRDLAEAKRLISQAVEDVQGRAQSGLGRVTECTLTWTEPTTATIETTAIYTRG